MSLLPWVPSQWFDDVGNPLAFGKLYFYQAGTLIPKTTYSNAALTVANTNPVVLDATGRANVWLIDGEGYDLVVHDQNDNLTRTVLDIVSGSTGGGGTTVWATEKESFPEDETLWLYDSANDYWRDDGCFCWIFPSRGFTTLHYMKSIFGANNGHVNGRFSIWGFVGASSTKLYESTLPDASIIGIENLNGLDISPYAFVGIAMDPGFDGGGGQPIRQNSLVYPVNSGPTLAPTSFAFIGSHAHNTAFTSWPTIKGTDPKYLITKWMAVGLSY